MMKLYKSIRAAPLSAALGITVVLLTFGIVARRALFPPPPVTEAIQDIDGEYALQLAKDKAAGRRAAEEDLNQGRLTVGAGLGIDQRVASIMLTRYGVELVPSGNCAANPRISAAAYGYKEVMDLEIDKRNDLPNDNVVEVLLEAFFEAYPRPMP